MSFRHFAALLALLLLIPTAFAGENETTAAATTAKRYGTWGVDLEGMDRTVKPGDDFFKFVNGKWVASTQIPSDRTSFGSFAMLGELSEARVRGILDRWAAEKTLKAGTDEAKVAALYRTFLDEQTVEKLDAKPIEPYLDAVKKAKTHEDVARFMGRSAISFGRAFFGAFVGDDAKNPDKYTLYVAQAGIGLPDREYYLRDNFKPQRERYQKYVADMLRLAGWEDPDKGAADVVALETKVAEAQWTRAESRDRDKTYNPMTIAELEKSAPGFPWTIAFKEAGLDKVERVVVRQNTALPKLAKVFADANVDALKAYSAFSVVDSAAPLLSKRFADAQWEFRAKFLGGAQEQRPRWKRAVEASENAMGEAIGRTYVAEYFPPESKAKMEKLVADLRTAMKQRIANLEWMGPETKAKATEKLAKFGVKIGYPVKWRDYSKLEIKEGDLVGNAERSAQFEWAYDVARIGKKVDEHEWGMTPDRQCLLPVDEERDRVPGRDSAAALLRSECGSRGELRRHRRGDRTRDHPRIRRPGTQVRRRRHAARLVGRGRRREVRSAGFEVRRAVRVVPVPTAARPSHHRQADHGREHRRPRRNPARARGLSHLAQGSARAGARRLHRRPARIPRMGAGVAHDVPRRRAAHLSHDQLSLPRHGPRVRAPAQRRRLVRRVRRERGRQELRQARRARAHLVILECGSAQLPLSYGDAVAASRRLESGS